jgi:hypothetical protein
MKPNCLVERDDNGRVIYAPGDGIGVWGKGLIPKISEKMIYPHTKLFHFLVVLRHLPNEDDYEILESIGNFPIQLPGFQSHSVAIGRLSWYTAERYEVFRMNDPDYMELGKKAVQFASNLGRRVYDYRFFLKIGLFAIKHILKELFTGHIVPRPVSPKDIPYKSDRDFTCIELYLSVWSSMNKWICPAGFAPVPAEIIEAVHRKFLTVIDFHNGVPEKWRRHHARKKTKVK